MVRGRSVEIVCGLVMVILGVCLSASAATQDGGVDVLKVAGGNLLTALGGVLLSWVAAIAFSHREAVRQLSEQVDAVSRILSHAATRVSRSVERCQAGEEEVPTSLALIQQATTMIYGQIDEIGRLTGHPLDSEDMTFTLSELDKLAVKLDREPGTQNSDIREDVARILARARGAKSTSQSKIPVEVECPHCEVRNVAALGTESGATARVECRSCKSPFNVHRSGTGTAFARTVPSHANPSGQTNHIQHTPPAQPDSPTALNAAEKYPSALNSKEKKSQLDDKGPTVFSSFNCSSCGTDMTVRRSTEDNPKLMVCTKCLTANFVTPQSLQVIDGGQFTHTKGVIVGRSGSQPLVSCPECDLSIRCVLNDGKSKYGFCAKDRQLMEVTHPAFEQWRNENIA